MAASDRLFGSEKMIAEVERLSVGGYKDKPSTPASSLFSFGRLGKKKFSLTRTLRVLR